MKKWKRYKDNEREWKTGNSKFKKWKWKVKKGNHKIWMERK